MSYLTLIKEQQETYLARTQAWPAIESHFNYLQNNFKFQPKALKVKNVIVDALARYELNELKNRDDVADYLEFNLEVEGECDCQELSKVIFAYCRDCEEDNELKKQVEVKVDYINDFASCFENQDYAIVMYWFFRDLNACVAKQVEFLSKKTKIVRNYTHAKRAERALVEFLRVKASAKKLNCELPIEWQAINDILDNKINHSQSKHANAEMLKSIDWNKYEDVPYHVSYRLVHNSVTNRTVTELGNFIEYASAYDVVMSTFKHMTNFKSKDEVLRDRYLEYRSTRDEQALILKVISNNWSKEEAARHMSNANYQILVDIDEEMREEGGNLFRECKRGNFSTRSIESLKAKLANGEKLNAGDRNWMSKNGVKASELVSSNDK